MRLCNSCQKLIGQPASESPHAYLRLQGAGVFGPPSNPVKHYMQYRCTSCGAWLHQNTRAGAPFDRWAIAPGTLAEALAEHE
ncbi:hypothetical protein LMG24235_06631 [Paraburkholderia sabiae]|nr:hypothetical protein LMG24235_06631 [Paraburkholderia sabiae]